MTLKRGFTIIELLVVITIIGILAATALLGFSRQRAKARDARRQQDISTINTALQDYINEHNQLVTNSNDNGTGWDYSSLLVGGTGSAYFMSFLGTAGYLDPVPLDPINDFHPTTNSTGYAYKYKYPDSDKVVDGVTYTAYSLLTHKLEATNGAFGVTQSPVIKK